MFAKSAACLRLPACQVGQNWRGCRQGRPAPQNGTIEWGGGCGSRSQVTPNRRAGWAKRGAAARHPRAARARDGVVAAYRARPQKDRRPVCEWVARGLPEIRRAAPRNNEQCRCGRACHTQQGVWQRRLAPPCCGQREHRADQQLFNGRHRLCQLHSPYVCERAAHAAAPHALGAAPWWDSIQSGSSGSHGCHAAAPARHRESR